MVNKCEVCRYTCKDNSKIDCKFYPKVDLLGYEIHFKEDPTKHYGKHETTSRMCVVCKEYFNYKSIRWIKEKEGLYSMCVGCARTNRFIEEMLRM